MIHNTIIDTHKFELQLSICSQKGKCICEHSAIMRRFSELVLYQANLARSFLLT